MAIFEIQGPDGSVYEVDAADENSAVSGFHKAMAPQQSAQPQPAPAQPQTPLPGASPALTASTIGSRQGLTFGFGDELMAGMTTPIEMAVGAWKGTDDGKGIGQRIADSYGRGLEQERALQKQAETQNPAAYTAGNIAGGMATAGQLSKGGATLMRPGMGLPAMALAGAGEGAIYGGLNGAGEAEGGIDQRIAGAQRGGITGAAVGAAVPVIAKGIGGVFGLASPKAAVPTVEELTAAKNAAYQRADDAGVVFTPDAVGRIKDRVTASLANIGYDPALQSGAKVALDRIAGLEGQNVTLKGLDTVRKIASNGYMPPTQTGYKSNNKAVSDIIGAIDDLTTNPRAADVLLGNAPEAGAILKEARGLASTLSKHEQIAQALSKAELRAASTGSGGNADNATRQNLRRILENPRGFTADEKAALDTAVRGTPTQNVLRLAGKMAPQGNGLMMMLQGGGAVATGGATIPLAVAGSGAKFLADRATGSNVKTLDALIRSGGVASGAGDEKRKAVEQIARALLMGGGETQSQNLYSPRF